MMSAKRLLQGRAGNHTWDVVQPFNGRTTGLDALTGNFTRLWTVETKGMVLDSSTWGSNTPGLVRVGDVPWGRRGQLNPAFYDRLERVVRRAERRDVVTSVVLFDNAFSAFFPRGWEHHPFNGLGPRDATQIHTKGKWNRYQRAHVKEVARRLAPYDNVTAEVGNELHRNSVPWFQRKVIAWWRKFSTQPIGASYASRVKPNQDWLNRVGADWVAPGGATKVPGFRGVQVLDTDHSWPLRSNVAGLSSAFSQGRPVLVMDGLDGRILRNQGSLSPDRAWIDQVI
jgi:hypothetical protein